MDQIIAALKLIDKIEVVATNLDKAVATKADCLRLILVCIRNYKAKK